MMEKPINKDEVYMADIDRLEGERSFWKGRYDNAKEEARRTAVRLQHIEVCLADCQPVEPTPTDREGWSETTERYVAALEYAVGVIRRLDAAEAAKEENSE